MARCLPAHIIRPVPAVTLLIVAASGLVAVAVAWGVASGRIPAPLAHPGARSLHARPVPRSGGIAIWAGWLAGWAVAAQPDWMLVGPLALVIGVSLIDDHRGLPPQVRILVHIAAAAAVSAFWLGAGGPFLVLEVLVIAWMANLYNFMDGADGLAGSMGVVGFGALAFAAIQAGQAGLAIPLGALAIACGGFLVFNLPPARLFMGDVGAVGLGFAAGAFGLKGWTDGVWPWWFPPMVFLPFIFDATVTLVRRILKRAPMAVAHRDHFYQQAILKRGRHAPTVAAYAGWMLAGAVTGLAALRWAPELGAVLLVVLAAGFAGYCRTIVRRAPTPSDARHAG